MTWGKTKGRFSQSQSNLTKVIHCTLGGSKFLKSISPKLFLNDEVQLTMLRNVYRKGADTENFQFYLGGER